LCVEPSQDAKEITDSLLYQESFSAVLNEFYDKGFNPFIFSKLKGETGCVLHPLVLIRGLKHMIGIIFAKYA
jgi:hypothetical protein